MITFNGYNLSETCGNWYRDRRLDLEFSNSSKIYYNNKPVWNLIGKNGYSFYSAKTKCLDNAYYNYNPYDSYNSYNVTASFSSQAGTAGFSFNDYYDISSVLAYQRSHGKLTSVVINLKTYSVADLPDKYLGFKLFIADRSGQTYKKTYRDLR